VPEPGHGDGQPFPRVLHRLGTLTQFEDPGHRRPPALPIGTLRDTTV
jgi:hypothetical protein